MNVAIQRMLVYAAAALLIGLTVGLLSFYDLSSNRKYGEPAIQSGCETGTADCAWSPWVSAAHAASGAQIGVGVAELMFSSRKGSTSAQQVVTIANSGDMPLTLSNVAFAGGQSSSWLFAHKPALPAVVAPGAAITVSITFKPTITGTLSTALRLTSNAANSAVLDLPLYGLSAKSRYGDNEPPFQQVVHTLGIAGDIGNDDLRLGTGPEPVGEEVLVPLFVAANGGPVGLRAVARYSPDEALPFGYYTLTNGVPQTQTVATIVATQSQTLNPPIISGGGQGFSVPGQPFGLFVHSNYFGRTTYTEDRFNVGPNRVAHAVRVYPARNRAGQLVPNSYLVAFEDATNGDYQDYVFLLSNAAPAPPPTTPTETTATATTATPTTPTATTTTATTTATRTPTTTTTATATTATTTATRTPTTTTTATATTATTTRTPTTTTTATTTTATSTTTRTPTTTTTTATATPTNPGKGGAPENAVVWLPLVALQNNTPVDDEVPMDTSSPPADE